MRSLPPVTESGLPPRSAALLAIGGVVTAALIGAASSPGGGRAAWYQRLSKPAATPPGGAIGVVWIGLEALLCVTGYRLLRARPSVGRDVALGGWGGCLAGLVGFPLAFFGLRRTDGGVAASAGMLGAAAVTVAAAAQVDRPAALAGVPLVLWTGFATWLSEEIWRRNR
jgi:tryptophan-rich sensory protein